MTAILLVVVGIGGWYFFIRDDSPPPVSLADAVASLTDGTTEAGDGATPEPSASGTPDPATIVTPADASETSEPTSAATAGSSDDTGLAGTWVLVSGADSFVGYRVAEELSTLGVTTAVGRTSDLSARLTFDGEVITAVEVEANLAALTSDDDRRDRALRRQALESSTFPIAAFSLTEPIVLESEPVDGVPIAAMAVGDLTLHGVTRSVTVALEGQLVGDQVVVIGSTEIVFADFDIDPPTAIIVVSVADEGTMEFQLILERA